MRQIISIAVLLVMPVIPVHSQYVVTTDVDQLNRYWVTGSVALASAQNVTFYYPSSTPKRVYPQSVKIKCPATCNITIATRGTAPTGGTAVTGTVKGTNTSVASSLLIKTGATTSSPETSLTFSGITSDEWREYSLAGIVFPSGDMTNRVIDVSFSISSGTAYYQFILGESK